MFISDIVALFRAKKKAKEGEAVKSGEKVESNFDLKTLAIETIFSYKFPFSKNELIRKVTMRLGCSSIKDREKVAKQYCEEALKYMILAGCVEKKGNQYKVISTKPNLSVVLQNLSGGRRADDL